MLKQTEKNEEYWVQLIKELTKDIKSNPTEWLNYMERGSAFIENGSFKRAVLDFNAALSLEPNKRLEVFNLHRLRSIAYAAQGLWNPALIDAEMAVKAMFPATKYKFPEGFYIFDYKKIESKSGMVFDMVQNNFFNAGIFAMCLNRFELATFHFTVCLVMSNTRLTEELALMSFIYRAMSAIKVNSKMTNKWDVIVNDLNDALELNREATLEILEQEDMFDAKFHHTVIWDTDNLKDIDCVSFGRIGNARTVDSEILLGTIQNEFNDNYLFK